jgi:uncharacterized protein YciI
MAYVIHTVDKPGSGELRARLRADHIKYLDAHIGVLLAAGALLEDDGSGGHGSLLIVDTDDRSVAEAFIAGDPFSRGGLFEKVTVTRWRKGYFDKRKLI